MATERQIAANRANARKSTGPTTPEGKRRASRNATLLSTTVALKGESARRFHHLASALLDQFQPRNSAEAFLVQTVTAARWRLLRLWGIQTAAFEMEMDRQSQTHATHSGPAPAGPALAALAFQSLADNSRSLDRQFRQALDALLKLRKEPDSNPPLPGFQPATETWGDHEEPDPDPDPEEPEPAPEAPHPPEPHLQNEPNSHPQPFPNPLPRPPLAQITPPPPDPQTNPIEVPHAPPIPVGPVRRPDRLRATPLCPRCGFINRSATHHPPPYFAARFL